MSIALFTALVRKLRDCLGSWRRLPEVCAVLMDGRSG
jgi:hypothetical protein